MRHLPRKLNSADFLKGWHVAMGFSVQILERATEIASWVGSKQGVSNYLSDTCAPWNNYIASKPSFVMEDSGL